jgi:gliding motility-associated-like protein
MRTLKFIFLVFIAALQTKAQDISLYKQFNGYYDYTAIGNTMNYFENNLSFICTIKDTSSAELNLSPTQTVVAAYLYWAGPGNGDFQVKLNDTQITAERTFSFIFSNRNYFSAFADVTQQVINTGNGNYTLSELDLASVIPAYCFNSTNFGGWAITVIYYDETIPLHQVNVYDGMQGVPTEVTINLDNLNVVDPEGSRIGFIAWEGDLTGAIQEQLLLNGTPLTNDLNPINNAFNGTNSFTGATNFYNMDIDVYDVSEVLQVGDTSATIQLTSGLDLVMVNNIISVINSELPDATIAIDRVIPVCNERAIYIDITVFNNNSTAILPAETPIAIYADGIMIGQLQTQNNIDIGQNESQTATFFLPDNVPDTFTLQAVVDDDGTVDEIIEYNNESLAQTVSLKDIAVTPLDNLLLCDTGFDTAAFDLTETLTNFDFNPEITPIFETQNDAYFDVNQIDFPEFYTNSSSPQTLFINIDRQVCMEMASFDIAVENCPPRVPQGFSPNGDGINDTFEILGLKDIFMNHQLFIYNRMGDEVYSGKNQDPFWNGKDMRKNQPVNSGNLLPVGTYFYVLKLNDPVHKDLSGWVYLNR